MRPYITSHINLMPEYITVNLKWFESCFFNIISHKRQNKVLNLLTMFFSIFSLIGQGPHPELSRIVSCNNDNLLNLQIWSYHRKEGCRCVSPVVVASNIVVTMLTGCAKRVCLTTNFASACSASKLSPAANHWHLQLIQRCQSTFHR